MTSTSRAEPVRRAGVRALGSGALAALFWVAVWQGAALAVGRDFLLASPWQVATRLVELLPTADFWATVWFSLARIALGFCAAAVGGALLAWAAWASRWARALIAPAIAAVRAAPVVSFIILLLLWTDSSRLPAFTSFLMVLPVMYANLGQGLAQRDRSLLEVAWVFDVPLGRRLLAMDIPGVLPYLAAATRAGVGLAWKAGVAAEVIGVAAGSIGERLYAAKLHLASADVFAWTLVVVALSVACERLVLWLIARVPCARPAPTSADSPRPEVAP